MRLGGWEVRNAERLGGEKARKLARLEIINARAPEVWEAGMKRS